tara:strand:- start:4691 stop:4936 length:246 start_codon:yes stop_codon:yes gene_type:complete
MRYFIGLVAILFVLSSTTTVIAKKPKSKFYDFSEQIIDGEVKRPTTLFTNAREAVKFGRLLKLKKSFLPKLFDSSKERVFK